MCLCPDMSLKWALTACGTLQRMASAVLAIRSVCCINCREVCIASRLGSSLLGDVEGRCLL